MNQPDAKRRQRLLQVVEFFGHRLHAILTGFFDARINHVSLPASRQLVPDETPDLWKPVGVANKGFDPPAAGRRLINHRNIQFAVKGQAQRARNGRGRHHQQMRVAAFAHQFFALDDAELMLLVNDDEAEVGQIKARREQRMGADEECDG